jgi:hypothetical protein
MTPLIPGQVYKVFECGCTFPSWIKTPRVDMPGRTKTGQRKRHVACPEHRQILSYFFKICPQCGQERRAKGGGRGSPRSGICPDCHYQNKLAKARSNPKGETKKEKEARYKAEAERAIKMQQASADCYDCANRDACLIEHWLDDDVLPCLGCERYESETIRTELTSMLAHDPCEWAYGEAV